jgi:hypothetical protein
MMGKGEIAEFTVGLNKYDESGRRILHKDDSDGLYRAHRFEDRNLIRFSAYLYGKRATWE